MVPHQRCLLVGFTSALAFDPTTLFSFQLQRTVGGHNDQRLRRRPLLSCSTSAPTPKTTGWGSGKRGPTIDEAISAAGRGEWTRAAATFARCLKVRPPHVRECNKYLRLLGDCGRIKDAVGAYDAMVAAGVRPTLVTFSTLISRAGSSRRPRVALRFYHEMQQFGIEPDAQAMNSLINAFSKVGLVDEALAVLAQMQAARVAPTVITFNSMIDACARVGDIERAVEVFGWVTKWGLSPNERTYSILIQTYMRAGAVDAAFRVLRDMRSAGLQPNKVTWTTIISGYGALGNLEGAFAALSEMTAAGLEPNVVTWTALIHACAKKKDLRRSFELFREMEARGGVRANVVTCSALMDACLKAGNIDLAFAVLGHMHDVGLRPTQVTYTSLLTECARLGLVDRAARVLKQMREERGAAMLPAEGTSDEEAWLAGNPTSGGGGRGDRVAVSSGGASATAAGRSGAEVSVGRQLELELLRLFGQTQRVDDAFRLLESMMARRELPDAEAWQTLFHAVETAKQFDHAVGLLRRLREGGQPLGINGVTYSALLGACGRVNHLTKAILAVREFRDLGIEPTEQAYVALLEACRAARDGRAAVDVFEMMRNAGVKPGVCSWTSLLKAISDGGGASSEAGGDGATGGRSSAVDSGSRSIVAEPPPADTGSNAGRVAEGMLRGVDGGLLPESFSSVGGSPAPVSHYPTSTSTAAAKETGVTTGKAQDNLFRVFLVFQEMRHNGVAPDRRAYNALVNSCASLGELDRAMEVVQTMVNDDGISPDVITYTSLIKAAGNAKPAPRIDQAEEFFAEMQQRSNHFSTFRAPNEKTYGHLMRANLQGGRHSRVLALWREMVAAGVSPGTKSSGAALAACDAAGDVLAALEVYRAIKSSGVRLDNRSLLHLHRLLKASGMDKMASTLLKERSATSPVESAAASSFAKGAAARHPQGRGIMTGASKTATADTGRERN